jgi:HSP20 family molecular chaperone IbpA
MESQQDRPVAVRSVDAQDLEPRLAAVRDRIRQRAYELYCARRQREAIEDWILAEHETDAAPLAGMAEEEHDIRITACLPDAEAADLTVDVLPDEIVVEADSNGCVERFTRFHLPAQVDARHVTARLRGTELEIVAPKAAPV